jgi:hypothetical protein
MIISKVKPFLEESFLFEFDDEVTDHSDLFKLASSTLWVISTKTKSAQFSRCLPAACCSTITSTKPKPKPNTIEGLKQDLCRHISHPVLWEKGMKHLIAHDCKELRAELEANGVVFQTSSDDEVVLQSWVYWGEARLTKLNSAYGFAIYDREEHALYLIRDRYGKRTLFYSEQNGELLFASEMKAFLGYENFEFSMDSTQLSSVMALWTPLPDQSCYQKVKSPISTPALPKQQKDQRKRTQYRIVFYQP